MALSDFVKSLTKSSLLAHLKNIDQKTMKWRKDLLDAVVTKDELEEWSSGGGVDHGALTGLGDDDHTQYLLASGTRALTADWDAGSFEIRAKTLESDVATGTAPLTIASTTKVANLNADLLDDQTGSYYLDHGNHTGLLDDDHTQYVLRSQWKQNGFVSKDDVTISWDDGTRTLSVTKTGASFVYFEAGVAYTKTTVQTKQIDDTEGLWVFYFDGATLTAANNPSGADIEHVIENHTIVAYVYWDATNNDGRLFAEPHGSNMSPSTHHYLHDVLGAQYDTGMALGDILADEDGSSNTHAQFSTEAGTFYDEDVKHTTELTAAATGLEIYYFNGSDLRWTTNAGYSFITYSGGSGRIAYNNSGTQTEVDNTKFVLAHVFASNIKDDDGTNYRLIAVQGQAQYATLALARTGADTEIFNLITGDLPMQELVPVATVIFQTADAYTNGVNARIRSTDTGDDYIDWRTSLGSGVGGSTTTNDHGLLSGLADDDHTQYILASGSRALTADWDAGSFEIRAQTLESDVATGTAPLTIASTTAVTNLNADLLDGSHAAAFAKISGTPADGRVAIWTGATDIEGIVGVTDANIVTYVGGAATGNLAKVDAIVIGPPYFKIEDSGIAPASVLLAGGTVPLTANWDAGSYEIRAQTLESDVATGTAPLTIASTTAVTNLNADMLDGFHSSSFVPTAFDSGAITMTVKNDSIASVTLGTLCYISGDSSGTPSVLKADADAESSCSKMLVMINETIASGATGSATVYGWVTGLSSLTAAAIYYASTSIGEITATAPSGSGDIVRIVGYAMSTTELFFNPDKTYIEIA